MKVLMTMMFKQNMNKNTENEFWRIMLWSFHWLFLGKWPPVDWQFKDWPEGSSEARVANTNLADGLRAVVWGIKEDLDVFATGLHLRHYNSNYMCDLCPAHRDPANRAMLYNNCSRDAAWQSQLYTAAQ